MKKKHRSILICIMMFILLMTGCGLGQDTTWRMVLESDEANAEPVITRALFMENLIKAEYIPIYEGENIYVPDVPVDSELYPYLATAIHHGIWTPGEDFAFLPEEPVDRGTASLWTIRGLGVMSAGENPFSDIPEGEMAQAVKVAVNAGMIEPITDGVFMPDGELDPSDMETLLRGASTYFDDVMNVEHEQKIVYQENVHAEISNSNVNVPIAFDQEKKTVTFANITEKMASLKEGNILFIDPCDNFPEGFLAKITKAVKKNDEITFTCEAPSLVEVISEADFAMDIHAGAFDIDDSASDLDITFVPGSQSTSRIYQNVGSKRDKANKEWDLGHDYKLEYTDKKNPGKDDKDGNKDSGSSDKGNDKGSETGSGNGTGSDGGSGTGSGNSSSTETGSGNSSTGSGTGTGSGKDDKGDKGGKVEIKTDVDFDADGNDYLGVDEWGRIYSTVNSNAGVYGNVHVASPNAASKKGFYASLDMELDARVSLYLYTKTDAKGIHIENMTFISFVDSNILGVAGYSGSFDRELRLTMPSFKCPIDGSPLVLEVTPQIVGTAKGSLAVEASLELNNHFAYTCVVAEGKPSRSEPSKDNSAEFKFNIDAEGSIELGPEFALSVQLIGTKFFDGVELFQGDIGFGCGIDGKISQKLDATATNDSANLTGNFAGMVDENGVKHDCYLCITGETYMFMDMDVGLGEDVVKFINLFKKGDFEYQFPRARMPLYEYHFSTGKGYTNEFEKKPCPHKSYQVDVKVVDSESGSNVSGATVKCGDDTQSAPAQFFYKDGVYKFTASADKYIEDAQSIVIHGKKQEVKFDLVKQLDPTTTVRGEFILAEGEVPAAKASYYIFSSKGTKVAEGKANKQGEFEVVFDYYENLKDPVQKFVVEVHYESEPVRKVTVDLNIGKVTELDTIYIGDISEYALVYLKKAFTENGITMLEIQEIFLGDDSFYLDVPDYNGGVAYTSYFSLSGMSFGPDIDYPLANDVYFGSIYTAMAPEGSLTDAMMALMGASSDGFMPKSFRYRDMSTPDEINQFIADFQSINKMYPVYIVEINNNEIRYLEPSLVEGK